MGDIKTKDYQFFADYPDVVCVNDLTKMLHIGKNKAYELINTNTIQTIKIGKNTLFPNTEL